MSLHLESPLSDSKMDISDATTSQEESPLGEDDEPVMKLQAQLPSPSQHINNHIASTNASLQNVPNKTDDQTQQNENDVDDGGLLKLVASDLDNRILRPELLMLELTPQRQTIERTLANNSHPLMSPVDADSYQRPLAVQALLPPPPLPTVSVNNDVKCHHNFPDVVPHYERLQPTLQSNAVAARNTLNKQMRGVAKGTTTNIAHAPTRNKLSLLRAHSPDLLSSESEVDISQYHATVEANFQTVVLIPPLNNANSNATQKEMRRAARKVAGNAGVAVGSNGAAVCDDISSLDSISNHSFDDDEDLEHNLASLSPSSSLIDGLDDDDSNDGDVDDDDDFAEATTPTPHQHTAGAAALPMGDAATTAVNAAGNQLPQYSAAEERRDSRNWQKITLPDGRTREIDMRVIEPYKRVLSHGGYLKAGGHNAIVIFCACHLPDRSRADYSYVMDNLFLYVVKTLEQLVTEDYVLIYLHGGTSRRNVPPFPWLKKCYQLLDRRLRKSLKNMYLVHPTFWIKSIVWMARPFVSSKFWRKLIYVKSLEELAKYVTVEKAAIPEKVKQYDAKHN